MGDAWRPVYENQVTAPMILVFVFLVLFLSLGLVNVVIGIFCERINTAMDDMKTSQQILRQVHRMECIRALGDMIWTLDADNSGEVSMQEFRQVGTIPEIYQEFKELDLPPGFSLDDLHVMLNIDGVGELSRDEFENGMYRAIYSDEFQ